MGKNSDTTVEDEQGEGADGPDGAASGEDGRRSGEGGASDAIAPGGRPRVLVTPRDRHLLALLAQARLLTTKQVADLSFAGRHVTAVARRLRALAARGGGPAYVQPLRHRTLDGRVVTTWALGDAGFVLAEQLLGPLPRPTSDVSPEFREHQGLLNELFVRLVVAAGGRGHGKPIGGRARAFSKATGLPFRWTSSDSTRLPWREYDVKRGESRQRVIHPDAIIELPARGARVFVECEMGTHTIVSGNEDRRGATLAKVSRYDEFLHATGGPILDKTFYEAAFPDGLRPEVLFLVAGEGRAQNVEKAVAEWGRGRPRLPKVWAATVTRATQRLLPGVEQEPSAGASTRSATFSADELDVLRSAFTELSAYVEKSRSLPTGHAVEPPTKALRRMAAVLARASTARTRAEGSASDREVSHGA